MGNMWCEGVENTPGKLGCVCHGCVCSQAEEGGVQLGLQDTNIATGGAQCYRSHRKTLTHWC